jgi:hypothetical protein
MHAPQSFGRTSGRPGGIAQLLQSSSGAAREGVRDLGMSTEKIAGQRARGIDVRRSMRRDRS